MVLDSILVYIIYAFRVVFDMIFIFFNKFCYFAYRKILAYPKGTDVGYLSIYLDAGVVNLPFGWSKFANFKFALINQANDKMTKIKGMFHPSLFSN